MRLLLRLLGGIWLATLLVTVASTYLEVRGERTRLQDDLVRRAALVADAVREAAEPLVAKQATRPAYDKLFRTYPQSDKAAAAHFKKGLAHLDLGEKAQAMVELNYVVNQFPGSDEAKSARQRLKALGGDAR